MTGRSMCTYTAHAKVQMLGRDVDVILSGATINLYEHDSPVLLSHTIWAEPQGTLTLSNPLTTDVHGSVTFWLDRPQYVDFVINKIGYDTLQETVLVGEPAQNVYDVSDYGALGDGVTDDTVAIQAAFDAAMNSPAHSGTVYFPTPTISGYYAITQTIRCYRSDYAQVHVNIECEAGGINGITISWQGASNTIALYMINNIGFFVRNLVIVGSTVPGGPANTTTGMLLSSNSSGTGTQNGTFINCSTSGFHTGTQIGGGTVSNGAASEIKFINHNASYCGSALLVTQQNTLDIYFDNLQGSANTLLGDFRNSNVFVNGGSASGNVNDFQFFAGGTAGISNFRSESCTGQFLVSTGGADIVLDSNLVVLLTSLSKGITADGGSLTLRGNSCNGYVFLNGNCQLNMYGNIIAPGVTGVTAGFPFDLSTTITQGTGATFSCINNRIWNAFGTGHLLDDMHGVHSVQNLGAQTAAGTAVARMFQRMTRDSYQVWNQELRTVTGISGTPTPAGNLRGSVTFASAATAAVVLGQAEIQTISITGGPPTSGAAFLGGQDVSNYSDNIRYNSTAANIQTMMLGNTPPTPALTASGGPLPGTPIVLTYTANGPQFLPFIYGSNLNAGASFVIARTRPGTLAEQDADYKIQVTGNVNETFWVTAKATGGFTINSSNATSTATVDWLLIR